MTRRRSNSRGQRAAARILSSRRAGKALMLATVVVGAGCARPKGEVFPATDRTLVWPLPPDVPRIRYVGELRGEADLNAGRSAWEGLQLALGTRERRPVRLVTPQSVAVSARNVVYVADTGAVALHVLDLEHRTARSVRALGENESLKSPVGVALGPEAVYLSDAVLQDVFEFAPDGRFRRRLGLDMERPGGLAYCPSVQQLYVVDTARHECVVVDERGERVRSFGTRGAGPGALNFPTHVHCSSLLGVLISDTLNFRVSRFTTDGSFVRSFGSKGDGAGDFALPKGVAVDGEGHIYVVDAQFENVQVFREDGRLLMAFGEEGSAPGRFAIPGGMTIDSGNRIWVADAHNGRLQVFEYLAESGG